MHLDLDRLMIILQISTLPLKVVTQRYFVADFIRQKVSFIAKTANVFLSHPVCGFKRLAQHEIKLK